VIQAVQPYFSPDDITKGARWAIEIASALEEISVGIICLTRENLTAPWIIFEAGALSKSLQTSKVCPLLFGVSESELEESPLAIFRAAKFSKREMKKVVNMINGELKDSKIVQDDLEVIFEVLWPQLETQVLAELKKGDAETTPRRSTRELLEDVYKGVRFS